jgi:hypothetical protein
MPEDVAHFKQAGANSVLGKPFQIEDLESLWVEWGVTTSAANFSDDTTPTVTFDLEQQRT